MRRKYLLAAVIIILLVLSGAALAGQEAKDVTLETTDGVRIAGTWYPGEKGKPGIVLFHMLGRDRSDWRKFAFDCQEKGYHVLAVDLRGHGQSTIGKNGKVLKFQNFTESDYGNMIYDATAAVDWLSKQSGVDTKRIGLAGASIGANVALQYAASKQIAIKTAVLLSPGLEYHGIATAAPAKNYQGSALYVAATGDDYSARTVKELTKNAGGRVQVKIYKGKEHGTRMFGAYSDLETLIFDWLKANLG